jgi:preprotein translocase SecE subunit
MLTLAKATSKEKGAIAPTDRDASNEDERDDEELEAQESSDSEENDVEDAADADLALPESYRQDLTSAPTRATARANAVPAWTLRNPFTRFIAESYLELRKVTWPTVQQAWAMTLVVVAMSAFVAILLGAADFGLIRFLGWILGLAGQ